MGYKDFANPAVSSRRLFCIKFACDNAKCGGAHTSLPRMARMCYNQGVENGVSQTSRMRSRAWAIPPPAEERLVGRLRCSTEMLTSFGCIAAATCRLCILWDKPVEIKEPDTLFAPLVARVEGPSRLAWFTSTPYHKHTVNPIDSQQQRRVYDEEVQDAVSLITGLPL